MNQIKTWRERLPTTFRSDDVGKAMQAEIDELRAYVDELCGLPPHRGDWQARNTTSLQGWINEVALLAEHPQIRMNWARYALQTIARGLRIHHDRLGGLVAALYYKQYNTNEDKMRLDASIAAAIKDYDIGAGRFR